jgi:hypothetical protein
MIDDWHYAATIVVVVDRTKAINLRTSERRLILMIGGLKLRQGRNLFLTWKGRVSKFCRCQRRRRRQEENPADISIINCVLFLPSKGKGYIFLSL